MNILQKVMACIVLLIAVCAMCVAIAAPFCLVTLEWFPSSDTFLKVLLAHGLLIGLILVREEDRLEMSPMGIAMGAIALTWFIITVGVFIAQYLYINA